MFGYFTFFFFGQVVKEGWRVGGWKEGREVRSLICLRVKNCSSLGVKLISKAKKDFWCNTLAVCPSPSLPLRSSSSYRSVVSRRNQALNGVSNLGLTQENFSIFLQP